MSDIKLDQIFAIIKSQHLYRFVTKLLTWSSTYTNIHAIRCIITISSIANATNIHKGIYQISSCFVRTGYPEHIYPSSNNESCS